MKWSVRDESLHSKMGCQLFNHMCDEYPMLREQVQAEVEEAARLMVEMEINFINKMFELGDLANLKASDLKEFIKKRANEKLNEIGYASIFEYSDESASELDWFYHLTGGVTWTDFFAMRSTDYSKAGEGEDWDEDSLF
jgi:ribonucleoside-diphosphate reductase beta chain